MRLPDDAEKIWLERGNLAAIHHLHHQHQLGWRSAALVVSGPGWRRLLPWQALAGLFGCGVLLGWQLEQWFLL